jgi:hypothetical protein
MSWDLAVKTVAPHIVRIETPNGYGTGFLAFWNHDRSWCGIATAAHVVKHAKREFEAAQKLKAASDAVDAASAPSPAPTVEARPGAEAAEARPGGEPG